MNCENCQSCGRCAKGSGCRQNAALNPLEYALLDVFSATPFLPVAVDRRSGRILLLEPDLEPAAASLALRLLERRGLVRVDAGFPLQNADYRGYEDWACGSVALTLRGQEAADALEYGGCEQEAKC